MELHIANNALCHAWLIRQSRKPKQTTRCCQSNIMKYYKYKVVHCVNTSWFLPPWSATLGARSRQVTTLSLHSFSICATFFPHQHQTFLSITAVFIISWHSTFMKYIIGSYSQLMDFIIAGGLNLSSLSLSDIL